MDLPSRINLEEVLANSYRDFHVKGFDYICLQRSLVETWKLYFFEGDVEKAPEVVHPHDHRYNFLTDVMSGSVENVLYYEERGFGAKPFNKFEWRTPLNPGPSGFTYKGETYLKEKVRTLYEKNDGYWMTHEGIHTIRIAASDTILMLRQYEDIVPMGAPTSTYSQGDAPSIDGLYSRFTADALLDRLRTFEERTGIKIETREV